MRTALHNGRALDVGSGNPSVELSGQKTAERRAHADGCRKISAASNHRPGAFVVSKFGTIERELHEAIKGKRALAADLLRKDGAEIWH